MSTAANTETLGFQTEIKQLMDLMVHSLYSNKEIFMRELVSNASDAADKLRFDALSDDALYEGDGDLKIEIEFDKDAGTLTIRDNGIGMTRDEVIANIGTIAKSGTADFFKSLTGDSQKDAQLIGQFGVGFYSVFIVADRVTLTTRRAGVAAAEGVRWESEGQGEFTLETIDKANRGTEIVLHMKEDETEFLDDSRLKNIIRTYSDHITLPIMLPKVSTEEEDNSGEWEAANEATALWTLSKNEISAEEYAEFYKYIAHDIEDPMVHVHSKVEGKLEYTLLLYIPSKAPFDLWERERRHGVKLYVKRVFIMDDTENLLPPYLRFVRGIVDSNDLPLNVSREILQKNRAIDSMKSAATKKVLGLIEKLAKGDDYGKFWAEFGKTMKEGMVDDFENKDRIAKLLRFASTHDDKETPEISLSDYLERMPEGQEAIYYVIADNFTTAKNSPHLEMFRKKGVEVLLLSEPIDEWLTMHLGEFEGKSLQSVAKGDLDLDKSESDSDDDEKEDKSDELTNELTTRVKEALADKVKDVRISKRLTTSSACLVADEHDMGGHMERLMKAAGQEMSASKPILEINLEHPIVKRLGAEEQNQRFSDWANILFDQSILAEGGKLDDPAAFVLRMNELFLDMAGEKAQIWTPDD